MHAQQAQPHCPLCFSALPRVLQCAARCGWSAVCATPRQAGCSDHGWRQPSWGHLTKGYLERSKARNRGLHQAARAAPARTAPCSRPLFTLPRRKCKRPQAGHLGTGPIRQYISSWGAGMGRLAGRRKPAALCVHSCRRRQHTAWVVHAVHLTLKYQGCGFAAMAAAAEAEEGAARYLSCNCPSGQPGPTRRIYL